MAERVGPPVLLVFDGHTCTCEDGGHGNKAPAGRVSGGCGSTTGDGDPAADYAVTTGPFRKEVWTINIFDYSDEQRVPFIVRQFGAGHLAPDLPTVEQLEAALSIPVFDAAPWNTMLTPGSSFRNALEGWQDCVSESCDPEDGYYPVCTGPHNFHNGVHLGSPENTPSPTSGWSSISILDG